jgi:hypothetical protein
LTWNRNGRNKERKTNNKIGHLGNSAPTIAKISGASLIGFSFEEKYTLTHTHTLDI